MVGVLVRLKLQLLRNQLRRGTQQAVGFVVLVALGVLGAGGFALVVATSRSDRSLTADLASTFGLAVVAGWLLLPIVAAGIDSTLDLGRLALLPLTFRRHGAGLLAAAAVGVGPLVSVVVLSGFVVRAPSAPAAGLAVAAIGVEVFTGLLLGRVAVSALSGMLRRRRAREIAYSLAALGTMGVSITVQLVGHTTGSIDRATIERAAQVARRVPLNLGGAALAAAMEDRQTASGSALAAALAVAGLLVAIWWALVARELTSSGAEAAVRPRRRSRLGGSHPIGAVARRELRYLWRHPVARTNTITSVLLAGFVAAPLRGPLQARAGVLLAAALVGSVGLSALNMLAIDGRAAWCDLLTADLATVLRGKAIARSVLAGFVVSVAGLVFAAMSGGWAYLAAVPPLASGALGVTLGIGAFASVAAPVPVPEVGGGSPWRASPGQGCVTGLVALALAVLGAVGTAPLAVAVAVALLVGPRLFLPVVAMAPLYGWLAWRAGLHAALARSRGRTPELLAALAPP